MTTIFTSYEKLFATWMMHHDLNHRIEVEPRFPGCDQTQVMRSYYTVPEEVPAPKELPVEELRKRRVARFVGASSLQLAIANVNTGQKDKTVQKPKPIYVLIHGPQVQRVEKITDAEEVKYGHFWGRTHFAATTKQTGYFLVDGWLVASIPKEVDEEKFEFNSEAEITVRHKMDGAEDPVSSEIIQTVNTWFVRHHRKLSTALTFSLGAALVLSVSVIALRGQPHLIAKLLSRILLVASFAMQSLCLYAGFQLYQLNQLQGKMNSIFDLGHWVCYVRFFAWAYPAASIGAPINDLFHPIELQNLNHMRNIDRSIRGTVSRFFKRIARNPSRA